MPTLEEVAHVRAAMAAPETPPPSTWLSDVSRTISGGGFTLRDATIDLSGVQHLTPGLVEFASAPIGPGLLNGDLDHRFFPSSLARGEQPGQPTLGEQEEKKFKCGIKKTTIVDPGMGAKFITKKSANLEQDEVSTDEEEREVVSENPKGTLQKVLTVKEKDVTGTWTTIWECRRVNCENPCEAKVEIKKVKKKVKKGEKEEEVEVNRGTLTCTCK